MNEFGNKDRFIIDDETIGTPYFGALSAAWEKRFPEKFKVEEEIIIEEEVAVVPEETALKPVIAVKAYKKNIAAMVATIIFAVIGIAAFVISCIAAVPAEYSIIFGNSLLIDMVTDVINGNTMQTMDWLNFILTALAAVATLATLIASIVAIAIKKRTVLFAFALAALVFIVAAIVCFVINGVVIESLDFIDVINPIDGYGVNVGIPAYVALAASIGAFIASLFAYQKYFKS